MPANSSSAADVFPAILAMIQDRNTWSMTIVEERGEVHTAPMLDPETLSLENPITQTVYEPKKNLLTIRTEHGDHIFVELPRSECESPIGGRPSIYLDQRDWSGVSNVRFNPERVTNGGTVDATQKLIDLARNRDVILPVSSAHLVETTRWSDGLQRYRLALTILELSRGWQMRYPLGVWEDEITKALLKRYKGLDYAYPEVLTLAPCALEPGGISSYRSSEVDSLPPEAAFITKAIVCSTARIAVALSTDHIPRVDAPEWTREFQRISDLLSQEQWSPSQRRNALDWTLLTDIRDQTINAILRSGIDKDDLSDWMSNHFSEDIKKMPCLGLWREVYQDKHLDIQNKWKNNDLIDMMFLTCACGYCTHVISERQFAGFLRQGVKRLGRSVKIFSRVEELVSALESDGIRGCE